MRTKIGFGLLPRGRSHPDPRHGRASDDATRAIKLIVAYGAGGPTDVLNVRHFADDLAAILARR